MSPIAAHRDVFLAALFLGTSLVACRPEGPSLPVCQSAEREATGHLSADIVGDWRAEGNEPDDHPAATLYAVREARRLWRFNADGSGYTWSLAGEENADYYDEGPFTWHAEGEELFISQLAPLIVTVNADDSALVRTTPEGDDAVWNRCRIEEPAQ